LKYHGITSTVDYPVDILQYNARGHKNITEFHAHIFTVSYAFLGEVNPIGTRVMRICHWYLVLCMALLANDHKYSAQKNFTLRSFAAHIFGLVQPGRQVRALRE
jgi:hypothetical protein